jgi:hypothetical protein
MCTTAPLNHVRSSGCLSYIPQTSYFCTGTWPGLSYKNLLIEVICLTIGLGVAKSDHRIFLSLAFFLFIDFTSH